MLDIEFMCRSHGLDKYCLSESCTPKIEDASTESDILNNSNKNDVLSRVV